jgi:hypothetical protein
VKQQNGWSELLRDGKAMLRDLLDATERRYKELARPAGTAAIRGTEHLSNTPDREVLAPSVLFCIRRPMLTRLPGYGSER